MKFKISRTTQVVDYFEVDLTKFDLSLLNEKLRLAELCELADQTSSTANFIKFLSSDDYWASAFFDFLLNSYSGPARKGATEYLPNEIYSIERV